MKTLSVTLGPSYAMVSGYLARELIVQAGGKSPMWLPRLKAWNTSRRRGLDVIAAAERARYVVTVTEERPPKPLAPRVTPVAPSEDVTGGLW